MKKIFIALLLFLIGCSSKKVSDGFLLAERYFENYIRYYNSGDFKLSEINFLKSVDSLQKADDNCNLSKIYIGRYLLEDNATYIEYAKRYALIGHCEDEINSINFLVGQKYDYKKLPKSLQLQAKHYNSSQDAIKELSDETIPDWTKSRLGRNITLRFININLLEEANKLIEFVLQIDRYNSWTYNLKKDLTIKKDICNLKKDNCEFIDERLDMINKKLNKN
ncbi:MAG: hypothetical protein N3C60_00845 [Calditerrivibrio sp.]|nr:hypothetical protein [Calditerrivibrio sp.]